MIRALLLEQHAAIFKEHGGEPTPPPHDKIATVRVGFLLRLEALIHVGCHFGPNDLPAKVWDELVVLSSERAFVERLIDERREKHQAEDAGLSKARAASGAPSPGGTIFPTSHAFK